MVIQITGKINPMDGVKFVALTQNLTSDDKVLVSLDSPGGAVAAGLTIGYRIHNNDWETMVMGDNICASACADIWLAGSTRYFTDKAKIGVHSSGIKKGKKMVRADNNDRNKYFTRLGLGKDAIVAILAPEPGPDHAVERRQCQDPRHHLCGRWWQGDDDGQQRRWMPGRSVPGEIFERLGLPE